MNKILVFTLLALVALSLVEVSNKVFVFCFVF